MMRRLVSVGGMVVLAGLLVLCGTRSRLAATQGATPGAGPAGCPTTTPEQNQDLVRRYWDEVYNERQPERADAFLADDFVRHNPGRPQRNEPGNADDVRRAHENLTDFPDLRIAFEDLVAAGDQVVVRLSWTGTQQAPLEAWGAPATGRRASYELVAIYRVRCGQLAEQWIVADYLSLLRQVGIVTDDELRTVGTPSVATPTP
jgi:predicted ester cyclase